MAEILKKDPKTCLHGALSVFDREGCDIEFYGFLKPKFVCIRCGAILFAYHPGNGDVPQTVWSQRKDP